MPLIAHYKLNSDATDSSGNGYHFTSGTASYATGKIGEAADFNGSGTQYLYRNPLAQLSLYLPWSIAFWVKIDSATTEVGTILNQRDASDNRVAIQYNNVADEVRILLYDNYLSAGIVGAASGAFGLDVWRHIALTWNGSDTLKLYFDGVLQTGTNNAGSSSSQVFVIGARYEGSSALDGMMDDLRIYDEALPESKIKSIYNDGAGTEGVVFGPYRREEAQATGTGAEAGDQFSTNALIGQDSHSGAVAGQTGK